MAITAFKLGEEQEIMTTKEKKLRISIWHRNFHPHQPKKRKEKSHRLNTADSKLPDPHVSEHEEHKTMNHKHPAHHNYSMPCVTEQIYEPRPLPPLHSLELSFDFLSPDIPAVVVCTLSLDL